jgi:hypothetical protein
MIVTLQEVFKVFLGRFQKCDLTEPDRRGWAAARRPPDGIATVAVSELSSGHPVVIGMCANPEPKDAIFNPNSQCPVVKTNPHGPENINLLEVQRRVVGVSF